jgi:hypothetical protein
MADPEGSEPDKAWERYEEADSEEGPLGAITSIPKVAAEAFFAQTLKELGELVGNVVVEWAGGQVASKALEAVETDREPPSSSPPSPPVDMGAPAMGVAADSDQEDAASPPWDPSSTQGSASEEEDDATAAAAAPGDQDDPPSAPVDMGAPAMGAPEEPAADTPSAHEDSGDSTLPDLNIGSPQWDPSANASGFAAPPAMPPIPLAPDPTE